MIERHEINDRAAWLAMRKQDVTASRVGALFGAHPYVTALRLYLEQSGIEFLEGDETPVMRRGRLLEGAVGLAVAEQHPEWKITKNTFYYRDPDLRLGATPDFIIEGDPRGLGVLQTKTAAPSVFKRDWDDGKVVPPWIVLQCLTEMILIDAAFGAVAVMQVDAFNLSCAVLEVPRHDGAEQRIKLAVGKFWDDVRKGHEPAPDYGKDASLLEYVAPREASPDETVDLSGDNELGAMLEDRARMKVAIATLDERCKAIETEIKFKIRDAAVVTGLQDWKITWKTQHYTEKLMPARDTRVLRIYDKRVE